MLKLQHNNDSKICTFRVHFIARINIEKLCAINFWLLCQDNPKNYLSQNIHVSFSTNFTVKVAWVIKVTFMKSLIL